MSAIGWLIGLWCLLFILIGAFQKNPARQVSSLWAIGFILLLAIQLTISYGLKGLIFGIALGIAFLLIASSKYGLR